MCACLISRHISRLESFGIYAKKRRQLAIRGILRDDEWIEAPDVVKEEFFIHFKNRFKRPSSPSTGIGALSFHSLSQSQHDYLELPFSRDEIKRAVWDCGGDRAPGPDGFTFNFFTTFWDIIEKDVVRFVQEFSTTHEIPKGCNPSFIALIPKVSNAKFVYDFRPISLIGCQYKIIGKLLANRLSNVIGDCVSPVQSAFIKGRYILDGPLVLNEILAEYRHQYKKLLLFKVDFEKAFDSVRWDYLDAVMEKIGFGIKWRSWISGCLKNARSSILVNGSPTKEFELFKGLRQGDPLSPFLFILAMEGLHSLTYKAEELGLFTGASIGRDNMRVSHLMYADDVMFFGEWSWVNAQNLISMLHCFFLFSGLKINIDKSSVLGVGVSVEENAHMARIIGCGVSNLPFKYLGIPVGCNMSRCVHWNAVIQSFTSKLSSWKARLLSVGGRLLLIKAVLGNLPTYFMSIYLMPVSVRSKLESMRSKFFRGADPNESKMSWILGVLFYLRLSVSKRKALTSSPYALVSWAMVNPLVFGMTLGVVILLLKCNSLGRSPRGGAEMNQFEALKAAIGDVILSDQSDSWVWSLDVNAGFSVMSARILVDDSLLEAGIAATRWIRHIPIKINVFLWRLNLNSLPSRVNLDRRGIEVDSLLCPTCYLDVETVNHIFFNCEMAKDLWALLAKWWELDIPICANISEWYSWLDGVRVASKSRLILEAATLLATVLATMLQYRPKN
ncbi:putative RNA-directed DNA polymerase, eukaryota, reverse transcriptase zinc-binding domain protein [Tanacetum coccineum]